MYIAAATIYPFATGNASACTANIFTGGRDITLHEAKVQGTQLSISNTQYRVV